jgi:hypothetical protein
VYDIKGCTVENPDINYKNRNINILSDSQAEIKALGNHQITSKLFWDSHQSLIQLATHNRVQLIWVPGHESIAGNGTADQLTKTGCQHLFIGPEPACSILVGVAKKAIRDWTIRNHQKYWESLTGLKQTKRFTQGPSAKRTKELLKLNRTQVRWVVGLLTGHCHLKGRLLKMGLTDNLICERCPQKDESAMHILCDCEAIIYLRFSQLGLFFIEPNDHYDTTIHKVLHFIQSVGLIKG